MAEPHSINLSQSEVRQVFLWDDLTRQLRWRDKPPGRSGRIVAGGIAGHVRPDGYRQVTYLRKAYFVHRLVWIYHNGDIPEGMQVDHINGNRLDNRPQNLRLATPWQQQRNRGRSKNNSTGRTGVYRISGSSDWRAQIKVNRKAIVIGRYPTMAEAIAARKQAEKVYGFHENHDRA